jgi:hypothetical protein
MASCHTRPFACCCEGNLGGGYDMGLDNAVDKALKEKMIYRVNGRWQNIR